MFKSKLSLLSFLFLALNQSFLFSGLLPDNIIYLGKNRYCPIKNLEIGDIALSSCASRNVLNNISGIRLNKNATNKAILLKLESKEKTLSSLMVGVDQRFCAQIEPDNDDLRWIEAENLEKNMLLLGYNNEKFKIRDVQNVRLENSTDLYEISLNPNNTFYLVDSNGNLILTHNLGWIAGFIISIACGAIIGGGIGAGVTIYEAYAENITVSKSTVAKGVLIGAAAGACMAAATYVGVYVGIQYLPAFSSKLATFIGWKGAASLTTQVASNPLIKTVFVGIAVSKAVPSEVTVVDKIVKSFIEETEAREKAGINLSGLDNGSSSSDGSYKKYGKAKLLDPKKIYNPNETDTNFVFATYEAN